MDDRQVWCHQIGDSRLIVTFPNKERVYYEEYMRYDIIAYE